MTAEEYFKDWIKVIDVRMAETILKKLPKQGICPSMNNVFRAFRLCPYDELKVIIIGQDPYNNLRDGKPVATGIAFANSADTPEDSYSPSLEILRESIIDFTVPHGAINFDPTLEEWEKQGVLLLNSALTCKIGQPDSHALLWRPFMQSLLTNLSCCKTGIVYILMGSSAQSLESCINRNANHIIRIRHPSYYARTHTRMPSDIWKQTDEILEGQNGYKIKWFNEYQ